jgi:hypothetical protein
MKLNRTLRAGFALLFALLLPLQGYAAMSSCGSRDAASSAGPHHCDREAAALHHHHCGDCCGVAIAPAADLWHAPHPRSPDITVAEPASPPMGFLDRLDRPPR